MTSITRIVDKQLEAYNKADFSHFAECYDPNIKSYNFETNELVSEMCGDKFFKHYENKFQSNPELHCEVIERVVHDNLVVDKESIRFFQGGNHKEMVVYQVKDNLITKMWFSKEISE